MRAGRGVDTVKNTGLAVLVDLGEADSLHPSNKFTVPELGGKRIGTF